MSQRPFRLQRRAAFYRQHTGIAAVSQNPNHPVPVDDAIAAGAADRRAADFALLFGGMLHADVFGMNVDEPVHYGLQTLVWVFAG